MTVSIETTRLSDVITGCGGKLTTCSRMSTLVRTASTNGTSRLSPGFSVRWYLPSRSTTSIRCCGTTRIDRSTVITTISATKTAIAMRIIWPTYVSVLPHHCGCALELDHPDPVARLERLRTVERPRPPGLAFDLYQPVVGVDPLEDQAARTLDRGEPDVRVRGAVVQTPLDRRPHHQ